jgi:nicotinamidase/pyrazinamidase
MPDPILFWDVDTQADFIYADGKLSVPDAEEIIPNLRRLTEWASSHNVLVIASADAHHASDPEFEKYPPHCIVGTSGQKKIPETRLPNALVLPNRRVNVPKDLKTYQQVILEKQELDVFSNPNVETVLDNLGSHQEIILYGVVTEICVAYAARGLLRRAYRLRVVSDAIRHLDERGARRFLEEVKEAGATLTTTEQLLSGFKRQTAA